MNNLIKILRVKDWWDKLAVFAIAYLVLQFFVPVLFVREFIGLFVFGVVLAILVYLMNTFADYKEDQEAGKYIPNRTALEVSLGISFFSLLLIGWFLIANYNYHFVWWVVWLSIIYSAWNLKKRGFALGIVLPAITQGPIQFLFFLQTVDGYDILIMSLFSVLLVVNIYWQILHQMRDYKNDWVSGVWTWVVNNCRVYEEDN